MKDDFSEVVTNATCYVLYSETVIYAYRNNVRYTYTKVGSKWWLRQQDNYSTIGNNYNCYSYDVISTINSKPEFEPIFLAIAFALVVFVYLLWFMIFKRITRWKV